MNPSGNFFTDLGNMFKPLVQTPEVKNPIAPSTKPPSNVDTKASFIELGSFLRDIAVSAPRAAISTGLSFSQTAVQKLGLKNAPSEFTPTGKVQEFVFGKEPIKPISTRGSEIITQFGGSPQTADKYKFFAGLGLTIADIVPGGPDDFYTKIAKSKDAKFISSLLEKQGIKDATLATRLVDVTDPKIVRQEIKRFGDPLFKKARPNGDSSDAFIRKIAYPMDSIGEKLDVLKTLPKEKRNIDNIKEFYNPTPQDIATGKVYGIEIPTADDVLKTLKNQQLGITERGFVTSAREVIPEAPFKGNYIPRDTDNLAIQAKNLIRDDLNTAEALAMKGTDDSAVATASELLKHYAKLADETTDLAAKNAYYDAAARIANTIAPKLTESGRTVQAASILGRLTPEGQLRFAAGEIARFNETAKIGKKIPNLTGQQAQTILDEMKAINGMADGVEKAMRFQKLQNYITDLIPTPLFKKIVAVWKAGLLTGVKTTGVNIFANVSHSIAETASKIPATMVDKITSLVTGKRAVALAGKGTFTGAKEGVNKGLRYLTTGFDERNIGTKLDYTRINFGKGRIAGALQKYTDTVFGLLGAEDQPFYYAAKLRSMYEQAKVSAINKGLKGSEAQKYIDNLIQNPSDEMIKFASTDAETAVFQNKTVLGEAAKKIQTIGGGAGEIVVPFSRTPAAVAMQILNYSPAGPVIEVFKQVKKGVFDQRAFSTAMGRGITGTGAVALGASLYKNGLVTTSRPTGEAEQKLWELEGKQPNSVKIGGKWRQVQVLGPLGNLLLIGGSFQKAFDSSGSPTEAMSQGLADASKSFTQQTFLTGVSNFIDAISDPARSAASVAGSTLASTIPTLVSDIGRAFDDKERRANTIFERFQARIPGVRESLQPQINVLGEERESVGNPLEILADPTRPSKAKESPVVDELRRLFNAGFKVSPTLLGDKKGYSSLTPQQNTELWKRAGEITNDKLNSLFSKSEYQALDDEKKGKVVDQIVDKSKVSARAEAVLKATQGLQGEQLKSKLQELKKSGLMSQEVFNLWQKVR